jgi:hypothetical protein
MLRPWPKAPWRKAANPGYRQVTFKIEAGLRRPPESCETRPTHPANVLKRTPLQVWYIGPYEVR